MCPAVLSVVPDSTALAMVPFCSVCFCSFPEYVLTSKELGLGASEQGEHGMMSVFLGLVPPTHLESMMSVCPSGSSSTHSPAKSMVSFLFAAAQYSRCALCHISLVLSPAEGHLGCFHFPAIVNSSSQQEPCQASIWEVGCAAPLGRCQQVVRQAHMVDLV